MQHRESSALENPIAVPIERVMLRKRNSKFIKEHVNDIQLEWEVLGCGYSWIVVNTIKDIQVLHRLIFSMQTKPFGLTQNVPFDGDNYAILGEVEGVLLNYSSVLVYSPIDRMFKQNYHSFQKKQNFNV